MEETTALAWEYSLIRKTAGIKYLSKSERNKVFYRYKFFNFINKPNTERKHRPSRRKVR